jgi:glycerol uptake facilitator protein
MTHNLRVLLAEALGTFILVLFGCGAVHSAVTTGAQSGLWQVAIVWGLGVMFAAFVAGGVSGAHINPAITIAFAAHGRFAWSKVGPYIAAQLAGAMFAASILFFVYGPNLAAKEQAMGVKRGETGSIVTAMCYGEYYPNPGGLPGETWSDSAWEEYSQLVPFAQAFTAELICTAILALVVFAVSDPKNAGAPPNYLGPIIAGLTVAALISIIAALTQCCLNPARDFGPRLVAYLAGWGQAAIPGPNGHGFFTVYILAPILGAVLGGGLYDWLIKPAFRAVPNSK